MGFFTLGASRRKWKLLKFDFRVGARSGAGRVSGIVKLLRFQGVGSQWPPLMISLRPKPL